MPPLPRLYSYCLPYDDGAAPNPFGGVCTLVICKPRIRAKARPGDWIAGTGSKYARVGNGQTKDMSGRLVYAMKVTDTMSMPAYDRYAQEHLPIKVPDWSSADPQKRLGDAIYEFSGGTARQRPGVHGAGNIDTDLAGRNALLSTHFFYFGSNAIALPDHLRDIAQNRQGHRVHKNEPYLDDFVTWIGELEQGVHGQPLLDLFGDSVATAWCAGCRAESDEADEGDDDQMNPPGC